MGGSQQFSLRWNNYLSHITGAFDTLRSDEDLVDVTLSCEGKRIRAHKMLLSACSTYFRDLFKENPCQHPVIIFRNVKFEDLVALIDFMYQGEVNVVQEQLASFLTTAELLAVQGLSEGTKDSSTDGKELELPDSPMLPPEPEVQMANNSQKKQQLPSTSTASVPSPVSFFPVDQRPDSPPSVKRRKWGSSSGGSSGVGAKSSGMSAGSSSKKDNTERDTERETDRRRVPPPLVAQHPPGNSSPDPIEIIPVVPNVKMELPDYMDQEQDASSCSYSDSNQGVAGGSGGQQGSSRDTLPPMSQLLSHSGASTSAEGKQEPPDMYSTNSRDASLPPSAESLSASDISQILAKPGPSGESQNQDSLQEPVWDVQKIAVSEAHWCKICGKMFRNPGSLYQHRDLHKGRTRCPICQMLLSRIGNMKRHMISKHESLWDWQESSTMNIFPVSDARRCKICGKTFQNPGSLYKHKDVHRGKTRCPICLIVYNRTVDMRTHMKAKHGVLLK